MTKEEYQLWAEHPQTKQFHKYLSDYRKQIMERWAQGGISGNDSLMAIARAQMADEIVNLDHDAISEFYRAATHEGLFDKETS